MRRFGVLIVAAGVAALTACQCNKSAGPQPAHSTQTAPSTVAVASASAIGVAGAPSAVSEPSSALPMVVVKALDFAPVKGSKLLPMKLQPDGVITRKGKPIAKITGDKLNDDDGSPVATFLAPSAIAIVDSSVRFTFNERDELEGPDGLRIAVGDDGVPKIVEKTNAKPEALTGKFVDFDPKARRAAAIVLGIKEIKRAAKKAHPKSPDAKKAKKKKKS